MEDELAAVLEASHARLDRSFDALREELRSMYDGLTALIDESRARHANVDRAQLIADWQREQASKNA